MPLCTMEVQERPAQASVVRLTRSGFFAVFDVLMIIPSGYPDVNSPMVWGSVLLGVAHSETRSEFRLEFRIWVY